ncbi:PDDEXK nuclease domain-containing protein [Luteimicrobium sp. DT211]|uniref:PDDEXK nuclease domain-containing protein n=1 Tax=Luteimicrobium sp. DT211 TaxID=3393412 RepID=UPI003CE8E6CB
MSDRPSALAPMPEGYGEWLAELKTRVYAAQQRAVLAVNTEMIGLYRQIGRELDDRIDGHAWGAKVVDRVAHDLRESFPEAKGFSVRNLHYMRAFAAAWPEPDFLQQPVARLPWGHNLVLLTKLKDRDQRLAYATAALEHGWSRAVLEMQIEARSVERARRAITNFDRTLPAPQSDLAREALKDPYKLDFLGLGRDAEERAIERALVDHVAEFLVELGAGFAYVGRQIHLEVGGDDFFLDLLFYHLKLRCYVVVELKATAFKPEHLGQLGFYLAAVDGELKHPDDAPTVGLLLCKTKNEVVAEYALRSTTSPLGVAEYDLLKDLPEPLATNLPTIEQIEAELRGDAG